MRRSIATLALVLSLAGSASASATARRAARICATGHCHTLMTGPRARLFRLTRMAHGFVVSSVLYGEDRRTGRVTTVVGGDVETQPVVELPFLAGTYAALVLVRTGKYNEEGAQVWIERVDLQTGRRLNSRRLPPGPAGEGCDGGLPFKAPGVTDLIVTAKGALAWLLGGAYDPVTNAPELGDYRVCLLTGTGRAPTVLAAGDTIGPRSLAATPERLYWSEGGEPRTAPLPG